LKQARDRVEGLKEFGQTSPLVQGIVEGGIFDGLEVEEDGTGKFLSEENGQDPCG